MHYQRNDARHSPFRFLTFLIFSLSFHTTCNAVDTDVMTSDPSKISEVARKLVTDAEISMIGAKGASQVSQLADQTQLQLSIIQIRQSEEIIKLLRRLADKK